MWKERAKEKRRQELEKKREERRKKREKEKERQKKRGGYNLATDRLMADKVFLMNLAEGGLCLIYKYFASLSDSGKKKSNLLVHGVFSTYSIHFFFGTD